MNRTRAQRENARKYGKATEPVCVVPATAGLPATSWWIGRDREDFSAAAKRQRPRMALSAFGRANTLITAKDTEKVEAI